MAGQRHKIALAEHATSLLINRTNHIRNSGSMSRVKVIAPPNVGDWLKRDTSYHFLSHPKLDNLANLILIHPLFDRRRQVNRNFVFCEVRNSLLFDRPQIEAS